MSLKSFASGWCEGQILFWCWVANLFVCCGDPESEDPPLIAEEGGAEPTGEDNEEVGLVYAFEIVSKLCYAFGFWIAAHTLDFTNRGLLTQKFLLTSYLFMLAVSVWSLALALFGFAPLLMSILTELPFAWALLLVVIAVSAYIARYIFGLWTMVSVLPNRERICNDVNTLGSIIRIPRGVLKRLVTNQFGVFVFLTFINEPLFIGMLVDSQLDKKTFFPSLTCPQFDSLKFWIKFAACLTVMFLSATANGIACIKVIVIKAIELDLEYTDRLTMRDFRLSGLSTRDSRAAAMRAGLIQAHERARPKLMGYINIIAFYEEIFGTQHWIATRLDGVIASFWVVSLFLSPAGQIEHLKSKPLEAALTIIMGKNLFTLAVIWRTFMHVSSITYFFSKACCLAERVSSVISGRKQAHFQLERVTVEEEKEDNERVGHDPELSKTFKKFRSLIEDVRFTYSPGRTYDRCLIFEILSGDLQMCLISLTFISLRLTFLPLATNSSANSVTTTSVATAPTTTIAAPLTTTVPVETQLNSTLAIS